MSLMCFEHKLLYSINTPVRQDGRLFSVVEVLSCLSLSGSTAHA